MKKCSKCGVNEPISGSWCRDCRKETERIRRLSKGMKPKNLSEIIGETKKCTLCKEFKQFSEFSPSTRGLAGLSTRCRVCNNTNARNIDKSIKRAYTQKYRDNNREWWRGLHRINQFNRKNKIKLVTDSTITKEFISSIYNTETCYYCNNIIDRENRTLEHKQPLNKEGMHTSSNIVMACLSCNASKRDMTEEQFKEYKLCQQVLTSY